MRKLLMVAAVSLLGLSGCAVYDANGQLVGTYAPVPVGVAYAGPVIYAANGLAYTPGGFPIEGGYRGQWYHGGVTIPGGYHGGYYGGYAYHGGAGAVGGGYHAGAVAGGGYAYRGGGGTLVVHAAPAAMRRH